MSMQAVGNSMVSMFYKLNTWVYLVKVLLVWDSRIYNAKDESIDACISYVNVVVMRLCEPKGIG